MKPSPCQCAGEITIERCYGKFALAPKDCHCAFGRCLRNEPDKCPAAYPFHDGYRDGHAAGFAEALKMAADAAASYEPQHEMNTGIARSVARNIASAIRSLATAPTGEKEG